MHMVIRAVVKSADPEEALDKAKEIFERIAGEDGQPFDYFQTFDGPGTIVSGKGRWGNIPGVLACDSKEGREMVEDGWKKTVETFNRNANHARMALKYLSNEQMMAEKDDQKDMAITPEMKKEIVAMLKHYHENPPLRFDDKPIPPFKRPTEKGIREKWHFVCAMGRYYAHQMGEYAGSSIWLYDEDGCGVRDKQAYDGLLDPKELKDGEKYWVVPADVHF